MKKNINRFLSSLRKRKSVTHLGIYKGEDVGYWDYYFSICGFLNGKYFSVCIHSKYRHVCEIVDLTDCKEEIKEIINKFNIA